MKKTQDEYINELKIIHGDNIDYKNIHYTWRRGVVDVRCNRCNAEWFPRADSLLNGTGCPECAKKQSALKHKKSTEEWINEAKSVWGDSYDYSEADLNKRNMGGKVCVICHKKSNDGVEHGRFWVIPTDHIKHHKTGCPKCGHYVEPKEKKKPIRKTNDEFDKELIERNIKDIVRVGDYKSNKKKLLFKCLKCGTLFENKPVNITHNMEGCPHCSSSKLEKEVATLLEENNIVFEREKSFDGLVGKNNYPLKFDFFIPEKKILIECQGIQHFVPIDIFGGIESFERLVAYDTKKRKYASDNHIKLYYYGKNGYDYPYVVYTDISLLLEKIQYT